MKDDTISRQAAIDLEYIVKNINGVDYVVLSEVQMKLRKLPSVQPDKDMIHLQKEQAYMQGWEAGREALREEMWEDDRDRLD